MIARRPRIALLTHGLDVGGGVPAVARWLCMAIRETGLYDVDLHDLATSRHDHVSRRIATPSTWARRSLRASGSDGVIRWGANAAELEFMRYRDRKELTRCLDSYDLVQFVAGSPAWASVAQNTKVPVVLQMATLVAWEREALLTSQSKIMRTYRRWTTSRASAAEKIGIQRANTILVENSEVRDHLGSIGHPRVRLAPPGVDTSIFVPIPDGHSKNNYLLSLCRLADPRKRLDRLVESYRVLTQDLPHAPELVIAGRGSLRDDVKYLISASGVGHRIRVLSDVPQQELVGLYQGAVAFVQTSQEEGLGISLLQAMACGLPVVATETAGSLEIINNGQNGLLVPQRDERTVPAQIASSIVIALSEAGQALASSGLETCRSRFSTKAAVSRFLDEYRRLLTTTE